jgi:hypothetical protein
MSEDYPTPPPELVQQWVAATESNDCIGALPADFEQGICTAAAQWGADQELEACCEWLHWQNLATHSELIPSLRAARRPKPPSLKEQALEIIDDSIEDDPAHISFALEEIKTIRRAIEQLSDAL